MRAPRCASIVITNYNYGRFLADAIESALAQSHENTEIIVVDDGSTDDSRRVMRRYANRVIEVCKANGGQASAYNAGFVVSRGDVVCFLDSDDTLFETAISRAVAFFQDPQVVKVEWQLQIVDALGVPTGNVVPEKPAPEGDLRQRTILNGPIYDWWFTPPSSGNCYSRQFLQRAIPVPEAPFRHGADVYFTVLAPLYGEIRRRSGPQGTYRVHDKNNYFGRPLDESRLGDYIRRFEDCCVQLQNHLGAQGVEVDIDDWKKRNFNYLWPTRVLQTKSDLDSILPAVGLCVLVNDDQWENGNIVEGRNVLPFLERDGEYWGPPPDDQTAIAELVRLRRQNDAAYIAFAWTAFWWLDHYPAFYAWLCSNAKCVLKNDRLIVFDIRELEVEQVCAKC